MDDQLGDRQKEYENVFRHVLPRRCNVIIRVDGKAFHTYAKNCKKPFDDDLIDDMNNTAIELCENIQNCCLAFVQSDEISLFLCDYKSIESESWFGNNIQKMVSVSASIATAKFNQLRLFRSYSKPMTDEQDTEYYESVIYDYVAKHIKDFNLAHFDSRIWILPNISEVANYYYWRMQDCSRNSLQMLARSHFSHQELENKDSIQIHDLLHSKNINWNDLDAKYKRGRLIKKFKEPFEKILKDGENIKYERNVWKVVDCEDFSYNYWYGIVNGVI